MYGKQISQVAV